MSLIVKIGADTRTFDRAMASLTKETKALGNKLSGIGKDMSASITLPIAAIGAGIIKMGSEFEAQMSQLQSVTHGSTKTMNDFKNEAMDLGTKTKFSATEAVEGMTELAKAGVKSNDVMKAIPATLTLASAGHIELSQAAAIAAREMNEFGMKATDLGHVADVISYTTTHAHTSVEELSAAMVPAGGFAHSLGMSYEDLNASLGIMSKAGLNGADAGQKMVAMMRAMAAPSSKAAKEQKALGLEFFNSQGHMKTMPQIIDMINQKTAGMGDQAKFAALKVAFTSAGMQGLLPLLRHGGTELQSFSDHLKNSGGYADQTAKIMNNNLQGSLKKMQSQFQNVAISLYTNFGPALTKIVDGISKLVGAFAKMSPEQQKNIMMWAAVAASFGPVLIMAGKAVMIFGKVRAAIMLAKEAQTAWGVASALAGGPASLIAIAIMAIIVAVVLLVQHWDTVKKVTIQVWNSIVGFFKGVWTSITNDLHAFVEGYSNGFTQMQTGTETVFAWLGNAVYNVKMFFINGFNAIIDFFKKWGVTILAVIMGPIAILALIIYKNWDTIKSATMVAWNAITAFLTKVWNGIVAVVTPIWNGIVTVISAVWNVIWTITSTIWNFIWQYLVALWTAFMYFAKPVFQALATFFTGVWNGIKAVATTVWNTISSFLQSVWNGIKAVATTVWNAVASFFTAVWNGIVKVATVIWNGLKTYFTTVFNFYKAIFTTVWNAIAGVASAIWNGIKNTASSIWNAISNAISGPINTVKTTATNKFNELKSTLTSVWNSIKGVASSVWNGISSSVMGTIHGLVNGAGAAFGGLKSVVVGVWEGIKSGIRSVINGIVGMINHFIDGFNAPAKALNKVPGVHAPTIGHIPALATGGNLFGDGMALVGEAGPELISKSGSSVKVTPLSASEKARGIGGAMGAGNNSGGSFSGTVEVPVVLDGKTIAKVVAPFMDKELRNKRDSLNRARGGN